MALTYGIGLPQFPLLEDRVVPTKNAEFWTLGSITWDNSTYAAGGVALTAANFGVNSIIHVIPQSASGVVFSWNTGTGKIQAWKGSATAVPLTECAAGDVNTIVSYLLILAR